MKNHIIFFSGGKSSFSVAYIVKRNYPNDNILLYFNDTEFEDEDLYRFIYEASDKLELPLLIHSIEESPIDLMRREVFLYNSRVANCSKYLKSRVAKRYLKDGIVPKKEIWHNKQSLKNENFRENPTLYFGISAYEIHREPAITKNWQPFDVQFPLIDEWENADKLLKDLDIKQPRLYDMGFAHNNCKGRCVKGGQAHWITLLNQDYKSFCEMRDFEKEMNVLINQKNGTNDVKYAYIKKSGEPFTLEELEKTYREKPKQLDIFDFGGCGCFVDEEND
jgi:hypothetical protein